ncbi:MAG: hypothetical protein EBV06_14495, partial [Planctomycetia bacterium]|nr:hypothetical protein [Planctomycetia bacterium]
MPRRAGDPAANSGIVVIVLERAAAEPSETDRGANAGQVAQGLYEGVDCGEEGAVGLITYMRTDSPRSSPEAIKEARDWIKKQFGDEYLPKTANTYQGKRAAQDAHEGIRPTSVARRPEDIKRYLSIDEFKLYQLIYRRFLAS